VALVSRRLQDQCMPCLLQSHARPARPPRIRHMTCTCTAADGGGCFSAGVAPNARLVPGPSMEGHQASIFALAWDPAHQQLASSSKDGRLLLWDARGRLLQRRARPRSSNDHSPRSIAASRKGDCLRDSAGMQVNNTKNDLREF
jgi:WD40 repeat protein